MSENHTPPTQAELDAWRKLFYEDVNWKCRVEAGAVFVRLITEVERLRKDKERLDCALEQAVRVNKIGAGCFYLSETRDGLDALIAMQQKGEE